MSASQSTAGIFSVADRSSRAFVGVDIGGTKTAVCISLEPPNILWRSEFATRPESGPDHALHSIAKAIREGLREADCAPKTIGVSCGGPLDSVAGIIQQPPNLPTWKDVPITSLLAETFGVPCALENDANAGALAEHRFGAGRGTQHMIFLTLGTGFGAGLILHGQLYRGASNLAGEIGHVRLTRDGPIGHGKQGSVEGWASGGGMARFGARMIREAVSDGQQTTLARKLTGLSAKDIAAELQNFDSVAQRIVALSGQRLGEALAILVDVLNPERIVAGGLALRFGEELLGPARVALQKEALRGAVAACEIVPAQLGERIGDVAALCAAVDAPVGA